MYVCMYVYGCVYMYIFMYIDREGGRAAKFIYKLWIKT